MIITDRTLPAFVMVPYGDLEALRNAITDDVVAVLLEPIQGESGVRIPPAGYMAGVRELTSQHRVLFIADEIQSGLGRTGRTLACEHENVTLMSTCWARRWEVASCRFPRSLLIMTCSVC